MTKCDKCKEWLYDLKPCGCEPYKVYYPDYYGEELETMHARSHEEVVEKVAIILNTDDPEFDTDLFEIPIVVTDKNGIEKSFNCVAIVDINYSVREI